MRCSSSLCLLWVVGLFFSISLTQLQVSAGDLVQRTCKQTPNYNLCVKSLRSDPRSSSADVAGLAVVMMDMVAAKTTAALQRISEILGGAGAGDPKTKAALRRCRELYERAVLQADIPSAMEALRTGNPKFAEQGANDAANEADSCEREFGGGGGGGGGRGAAAGVSPITALNRRISDLSRVASAIIRLLL